MATNALTQLVGSFQLLKFICKKCYNIEKKQMFVFNCVKNTHKLWKNLLEEKLENILRFLLSFHLSYIFHLFGNHCNIMLSLNFPFQIWAEPRKPKIMVNGKHCCLSFRLFYYLIYDRVTRLHYYCYTEL